MGLAGWVANEQTSRGGLANLKNEESGFAGPGAGSAINPLRVGFYSAGRSDFFVSSGNVTNSPSSSSIR
jgi:hypothetical protein